MLTDQPTILSGAVTARPPAPVADLCDADEHDAGSDVTLPGAHRGTRIVVAEDDETLRELVSAVLELDGHEVIRASNGRELMNLLHLHASNGAAENCTPDFDLLVTDLRMPMFSGFEVIERVRAGGSGLPVVMMTAFPDDAVHAAADQHDVLLVAKPFRPEALRLAVDVLLELHQFDRFG